MSIGPSGALRAAVVVLLSSVAVAAYALPFTRGNIIVSGTPTTVKELTPTGTLVQTLPAAGSGSFTTGMCFDSSGKLLLTLFSDGAVALYNTDGTLATVNFITAPGEPEACVRDAAGNFYVTSVNFVAAIRKYSSTGTLLQTFLPGVRSDWMDLATDQCTMYWDDEGTTPTIHRFNVCTGTALPVLGGSSTYTALRVLPGSGDILVANEGANRVDRFTVGGTLLGSWTPTLILGVIFSLNLDPDGVTFWTGGTGGSVHRFALAGFGPQITRFDSGNAEMFGLTVVGEITTGGPGAGPAEVPTLSQWALIALAVMLAGGAALGLRRRNPKI